EYAVNQSCELIERTSFIEGYRIIKDIVDTEISIKKLASITGLSEDKIKRYFAYFQSRDIFIGSSLFPDINDEIVKKFVNSIGNLETIKKIQSWDCWRSYSQFLLYRYHPDVMRQYILTKRQREKKNNSSGNQSKIKQIVDQLFLEDKDITIAAVSE